ncbi:MAG: Mut7-C RNAse domain-containing protein [Candidatus ainarchaeum sp.]|nr:Mut7-C RNAse domain-containing protein [Candidatus ainarchaeum sp.]
MSQTFFADAMHKKLARWLRIFGADAEYLETGDNEVLERLRKSPERVLLTQDVQLHARAVKRGFKSFLVPRDAAVEEQVALIFGKYGIPLGDFPSKTVCPQCNGALKPAGKGEVAGRVPEKVFARHEKYWSCAKCKKAYWEGTHWQKISEAAGRVKKRMGGG